MTKILVLGHTGMLGRVVTSILSDKFKYTISTTNKRWGEEELIKVVIQQDLVINCCGLIPQRALNATFEDYYSVNTLLPISLLRLGVPLIHACTDCIFSGNPKEAPFKKNDHYNAVDAYGRSKLSFYQRLCDLGEVKDLKVVRTSVIGEDANNKSLLSWCLKEVCEGRRINGYTNHIWNGVTNLYWSLFVEKLISSGWTSSYDIFQIGSTPISKYQLLCEIVDCWGYDSSELVKPTEDQCAINKTLVSDFRVPSIKDQLNALKVYQSRDSL